MGWHCNYLKMFIFFAWIGISWLAQAGFTVAD
jgi:hypothetical protein